MSKFSSLHERGDLGLLVLRLVVGVIFLTHGMQKWALWGMEPNEQLTSGTLALMKFLSIVEPLGGLAMITGMLVQWSALGFGLVMLGAILMKITLFHTGFIEQQATGWEFDLAVLAANVNLFITGAGRYSIGRSKKPETLK